VTNDKFHWAKTMPSQVLFICDNELEGLLIELILTTERGDTVRWVLYHDDVLADAEKDPPDLIILEFTIRHVDVLGLCQLLRAGPVLKDIPILLWGVSVPERVHQSVKPVGIQGYLPLVCGPQDLLAARDAVLRGDTYYPLDKEAQ
jgi:PleD family two-component response regulator